MSKQNKKNRDVTPFNPLDKDNLAESAANALLANQPEPMDWVEPFVGAGVYAIYYIGDFDLYFPLKKANEGDRWDAPIYVGKADPKGKRKGRNLDESNLNQEKNLFKRLSEHTASINDATNLEIKDFYVRFLVVDDLFISLVENLLISKFMPIWNMRLDGFGNHAPGGGRAGTMRPRWDFIHPGREWAAELPDRKENREEVEREIKEFYDEYSYLYEI